MTHALKKRGKEAILLLLLLLLLRRPPLAFPISIIPSKDDEQHLVETRTDSIVVEASLFLLPNRKTKIFIGFRIMIDSCESSCLPS